MLSPKAVKT